MSVFLTRPLPAHVEAHRYGDVDIQEVFARGAAIITDYSSNAFELAYLNRPAIYFQFDRDRFFSGQHVYRRGEWSYERDGFGPVVERVSEVLDELQRLVDSGMTAQEPYATRIDQAFAFRDGKSCERVFESILSARRPVAAIKEPRQRPLTICARLTVPMSEQRETPTEIVDTLTATWQALSDLGAGLTEAQWKTPTRPPRLERAGHAVPRDRHRAAARRAPARRTAAGRPATARAQPDRRAQRTGGRRTPSSTGRRGARRMGRAARRARSARSRPPATSTSASRWTPRPVPGR